MLAPNENPMDEEGGEAWVVVVAMIAFAVLITGLVLLGGFD